MNNLPIEIVYEILAFSGHGTLRYGYIHYDKVIKPCQFIFKLQEKMLNIKRKPIEKTTCADVVRLQITDTKHMDIEVSPYNINREWICQWKYQIIVWDDPNRYFSRPSGFCWHLQDCPTRTVIHTEYF
jgi:hypothetical protein